MSKGGGDAPDTVGAARETGEQARRLNEAQTAANRPNQYNAWGSTQWEQAPIWDQTTGQYVNQWTQRETLNPEVQRALTAQQQIGAGRSELAQGMMARASDDMRSPMDFDQYGNPIALDAPGAEQRFEFGGQPVDRFAFGGEQPQQFNFNQGIEGFNYDPGAERSRAENASYQRATSRLDPQFSKREDSLTNRLRNQGLAPGDQAYDAAMANLGRERTDAYEMARLGSVGEGRQEAGQMFQQALGTQQQRVGEQGQGFGQAATTAGFNRDLQGQLYQQALAGQQQNVAQQGQEFGQEAQGTQLRTAQQAQEFGQASQQNQVANALRSQQIQEDLYRRGFSLQEVERMLAGQGIAGGPPSTGGETETLVGDVLGTQ